MKDHAPITLTMVLHRDEGAGLRVSLEGAAGAPVVLPLSQISVEQGIGRQLRITMPMWLAKDRNLIASPDARQGSFL